MRSIEYTEFQEHQNLYRIVILPILQSFFLRSQRELQMESFLSAVLGELMTRSVSFIINYSLMVN